MKRWLKKDGWLENQLVTVTHFKYGFTRYEVRLQNVNIKRALFYDEPGLHTESGFQSRAVRNALTRAGLRPPNSTAQGRPLDFTTPSRGGARGAIIWVPDKAPVSFEFSMPFKGRTREDGRTEGASVFTGISNFMCIKRPSSLLRAHVIRGALQSHRWQTGPSASDSSVIKVGTLRGVFTGPHKRFTSSLGPGEPQGEAWAGGTAVWYRSMATHRRGRQGDCCFS